MDSVEPQTADLRWLGRFVLGHRRAAVLALGTGMVGGVTAALEPYVIGVIIDHITVNGPFGELVLLIGLMFLLAVITMIAFFGQRRYSGEVAYSVNYDVRRTLFDHMLTLDQGFYRRYPTGDLISRMHSDIEMIWRLMAISFTRFGSAVVTVIVTFLLLATINLPLTIVVFIVLAISTSLQVRAGLVLAPMFEQVQAQAGNVSAMVQDAVSGIQTIKTAGKEAGVAAQFHAENREFRRRWLFFKRRYEPVGMLPNMISELTAAVVVLVGGVMALNGMLTLGDFTKFLVSLGMIATVLLQLGTIYQRYQQTLGALTRLTPLLQTAAIRSAPQPRPLKHPRGEITLERVTVEEGGTRILDDVSLHIPAGATVALVGPTGCGKTTLVSLLARVSDPSGGSVKIDGVDVRDYALDDLREAIAYVPQSTFLFSMPLHENVRMGKPYVAQDALESAVYTSRLSNDLPQLPLGLDTMVGERGVMLSGGQKQRVAIARAIIRDPAVLVLDDALSSVDTHTAADILNDLRHVLHTRTSLIIAHRIATVKDADFIVLMNEGRIVEQGTHHALLARGGLYAEMVARELSQEVMVNAE